MRQEVPPGAGGIISVRHGLNSKEVQVKCVKPGPDGQEDAVAYVISDNEVEVVVVPGSGVTAIIVETLDGVTQDQPKQDVQESCSRAR